MAKDDRQVLIESAAKVDEAVKATYGDYLKAVTKIVEMDFRVVVCGALVQHLSKSEIEVLANALRRAQSNLRVLHSVCKES